MSVYLRADIDALPIEEDTCNNKQPKTCLSKIPGVRICTDMMHIPPCSLAQQLANRWLCTAEVTILGKQNK